MESHVLLPSGSNVPSLHVFGMRFVPSSAKRLDSPCRAGFVLEVGALAESKDGTRCIGLESKEVLRGEAEVTRHSPHLRA